MQLIALPASDGQCTARLVVLNNDIIHIYCQNRDCIHIFDMELTVIYGFITGHVEMNQIRGRKSDERRTKQIWNISGFCELLNHSAHDGLMLESQQAMRKPKGRFEILDIAIRPTG